MKVTNQIDGKRRYCLLKVEVAESLGSTYEDTDTTEVIAMVDSGGERTAISERLFLELGLPTIKETEVSGAESHGSVYTRFHLLIPDLFNGSFPVVGVTVPWMTEFDILIGNDFLDNFKFERDGKAGTFTLSAE